MHIDPTYRNAHTQRSEYKAVIQQTYFVLSNKTMKLSKCCKAKEDIDNVDCQVQTLLPVISKYSHESQNQAICRKEVVWLPWL